MSWCSRRKGLPQVNETRSPVVVRRTSVVAFLSQVVCLALVSPCLAFNPNSPEVQALVSRGIAYLESDANPDSRMGALALEGLAIFKHTGRADHRNVVKAIEDTQKMLQGKKPEKFGMGSDAIYSTGLAAIFLISVDSSQYAPEIQFLLDYLQLKQKPHGGWGYENKHTGDTSMTQYGVLSSWEATQAGFRVPHESVETVATWLLKTQDPSGAFGYQGTISDTFEPVRQTGCRLSLSAAGLGSTYICADLLGFTRQTAERSDGLPAALREVADNGQPTQRQKTRLPGRLFQTVQQRGTQWLTENYKIDPPEWPYYYMYALERYMSFRELAEGRTGNSTRQGPDVTWYDDGVRFLAQKQAVNGSWGDTSYLRVNTSFAILFLLRSTQQSIKKSRSFGAGVLVGGRGLPKQTSHVKIREGKVVPSQVAGSLDDLLTAAEDADSTDFDAAVESLAAIPPEEANALNDKQADQLRRLAGASSAEARAAAVQVLSNSRDLDNTPVLIFALTDPDRQVQRLARDGLRRLSRKPEGFGLSDKANESDVARAVDQWKAWYRAVRPEAEFINPENVSP